MSRDEEKNREKNQWGYYANARCQGKRQRAFHDKLTQIEGLRAGL